MSITNDKRNELKESILHELNRLGNGTPTMWKVFILCITPAILNGLHMSSYVFVGKLPDDYYCVNSHLIAAGWNNSNIHNISTINVENSCNVLNWNYTALGLLETNADIEKYINSVPWPNQRRCQDVDGGYFYYENAPETMVAEWDLICDREALRPTVQMSLSFGKFVGAFVFGIVADKYGRKTSVTVGGLLYIIFGPIAAFSTSYWLYVFTRFAIGVAGSAVFHSAYTILTEFTSKEYRPYLSIVFNLPYPVGMIIMAFIAYFIRPWRWFQLAIALPALLLIPHYFIFKESPRWLVNKERLREAYRIVFGRYLTEDEYPLTQAKQELPCDTNIQGPKGVVHVTAQLVKDGLTELRSMYGNKLHRNRLLICHLSWFTTSLAYYVLALNGTNLHADQYVYITISGLTEIPSYFIPMIMFRWLGRRSTSIILFFISGICLLLILALPDSLNELTIALAIFARVCVSATFSILILHAAEMFPTEIRNSAIGVSSTMSHIGSISAPYIVDSLGVYGWFIPSTICGITCLGAGALMFLQPETKGMELDERIDGDKNRR